MKKSVNLGLGDLGAQMLRVLPALGEHPRPVPRTHMRRLPTNSNSSSWGPSVSGPQTPALMCTHTQTHTIKGNINLKERKVFSLFFQVGNKIQKRL